VRRKREAALNGCPDVDAVPEREHPWPFDPRERLRSGCESDCAAAGFCDSVSSENDATLWWAFGDAMDDCVASLRKFYERTAEENSARITNRLHQKGQRKRRQSCMIVLPSLDGFGPKQSCRFVTLFVQHALLPIRCP
jgi:hypothetical protein